MLLFIWIEILFSNNVLSKKLDYLWNVCIQIRPMLISIYSPLRTLSPVSDLLSATPTSLSYLWLDTCNSKYSAQGKQNRNMKSIRAPQIHDTQCNISTWYIFISLSCLYFNYSRDGSWCRRLRDEIFTILRAITGIYDLNSS